MGRRERRAHVRGRRGSRRPRPEQRERRPYPWEHSVGGSGHRALEPGSGQADRSARGRTPSVLRSRRAADHHPRRPRAGEPVHRQDRRERLPRRRHHPRGRHGALPHRPREQRPRHRVDGRRHPRRRAPRPGTRRRHHPSLAPRRARGRRGRWGLRPRHAHPGRGRRTPLRRPGGGALLRRAGHQRRAGHRHRQRGHGLWDASIPMGSRPSGAGAGRPLPSRRGLGRVHPQPRERGHRPRVPARRHHSRRHSAGRG